MSVLNKKTRMISFRLSESEYVSAEKCCPANGVRSVSSLARNATISLMNSENCDSPGSASGKENAQGSAAISSAASAEILIQLQHQVLWLRAELDRITTLIGKPAALQAAASSLPQ